MKGVMIPDVSAGSNHVGVSEMCTAQVAWPSGAASLGAAPTVRVRTTMTMVERPRTMLMEASFAAPSRRGTEPVGTVPEQYRRAEARARTSA